MFFMDRNSERKFLAAIVLGCGVYFARELYIWYRRYYLLYDYRKLNGYERFPPYGSFPDLRMNNTFMARHLTPWLYESLRCKTTPSGYTLQKAIQVGVDNPGKPWQRLSGVLAGDEESYHVFSPLFDQIIEDCHGHRKEVKHYRNTDREFKGKFQAPSSDWPDNRHVSVVTFHNSDHTFVVRINEEDHVQVTCSSDGADLKAAFDKFSRGMASVERELNTLGESFAWHDRLGYIVSDPVHLGTALEVIVRVEIARLMDDARLPGILRNLKLRRCTKESGPGRGQFEIDVCSTETLSVTEVKVVQTMIDGVRHLVELEKSLEQGQEINPDPPAAQYREMLVTSLQKVGNISRS